MVEKVSNGDVVKKRRYLPKFDSYVIQKKLMIAMAYKVQKTQI